MKYFIQAADQLLQIIQNREKEEGSIDEDTICIGLARVSSDSQSIVSGPLNQMKDIGKTFLIVFSGSNHFIPRYGRTATLLHCYWQFASDGK